jgi:hypothetical protein
MSDILQKIQLKKEALAKQAQALESPDLQKKIQDYQYWSTHLPILKKEIESLIGESLDEAASPAKSARGRRKGSPSVSDEVMKQKIIETLAKAASDGLAAVGIRDEISKDFKEVAESTIYQKVSNILKTGEGDQFRKTGELKKTKWFLVQK